MDPVCCETDTAAAASSTMVFAAAVDGAEEEEVRAEAIGASDVTGWWMGSTRRHERRALTAEAAVAPPLHMAAAGAGCGVRRLRGPVVDGGNGNTACEAGRGGELG